MKSHTPRNLLQPLEIQSYRTDTIGCRYQSNTFFELVFVESGQGHRIVDGHTLPFQANELFLHLPDETNAIHLAEFSVLHFIKFQRVVFNLRNREAGDISFQEWFKRLEFILFSKQQLAANLITIPEDQPAVALLFQLLIQESEKHRTFSDVNHRALLLVLLNITARNILHRQSHSRLSSDKEPQKDLLTYVHYHIYEPDKITIAQLAKHFAIAPSYFSEYFRTQYGIPFKQYILQYKLTLAENKLRYTTLSLSEIASELHFTDTSHLNKMFLRHKGYLPRTVREKEVAA